MRRFAFIAAVSLLAAACSQPQNGANFHVPDDLGTNQDTSANADLAPVPEGEVFAELEDASEIQIYDAGEFLFVVADGSSISWVDKGNGAFIQIATWPDMTAPDSGPPSRDVVWDDERFWFLTETSPGQYAVAGIEHLLGSPSPFFGQPIIVIDVGPLMQPGGLSLFGTKFAIPTATELVTVGENLPVVRIPLGGEPTFDHMDEGWLFVTVENGFELKHFSDDTDALTVESSFDFLPRAFASSWAIEADGALNVEGVVVLQDTESEPSPLLATDGTRAAWTSDGEVRVYQDELMRFRADQPVDAIVVDATHVYWTTATKIHRGSLDQEPL
jgi:hypothetical protein